MGNGRSIEDGGLDIVKGKDFTKRAIDWLSYWKVDDEPINKLLIKKDGKFIVRLMITKLLI